MSLQHFNSEIDALEYIKSEIVATLRDDLDNMEGADFDDYSDEDRAEMAARIADIEAVLPFIVLNVES